MLRASVGLAICVSSSGNAFLEVWIITSAEASAVAAPPHEAAGRNAFHMAAARLKVPRAASAYDRHWMGNTYKALARWAWECGIIDAMDPNGRTALHIAAAHCNREFMRALLGAGAGALLWVSLGVGDCRVGGLYSRLGFFASDRWYVR